MDKPNATAAACEVCGQPATRTYQGQVLCAPCALYACGQDHARASAARDELQSAIGTLLDTGVSSSRIEALTRAFVDADVPPVVVPKTASSGDPRPWASLLEPLTG